ncbi:MAG: tripartite tricarboxylate transporter substrate binding protein [Betaproteobacteria bacterium]|nr:tripartite tricarboxylate transporter substrate binding protein [Betaproteobacteria bacterium]
MKPASTLLLCVACLVLSPAASGQAKSTYPVKPVRMIVPGAPGGLTDLGARILSPRLAELLGQPVVVDSRSGAAGLIACDLVAKAAPDGYTLLFGFSGPLVIVPHLNESTPYDTLKDFAPVALVATAPYVLVVNPKVPAKLVKELIALARSRPGKLNFASGGVGTGIHMAAELLNLSAGTQIVHVTYKSALPALTAILAGEVDMMFIGLTQALPHIKAGRLRALAVGSAKRSPAFPELPTVSESGFQFSASGWYGVLAPRNTPRPLVTKLHETLATVVGTAEVRDRMTANALEVEHATPEQFGAFLRNEMATWAGVVKAAGLKRKGPL